MITNQRSFRKRAKKKLLKPLNFLVNPLQNLWLNKNNLDFLYSTPPVFIIGPPRSGTTVLYQLLCKHFNFAYINNFIADWYNAPVLATKAFNIFIKDRNQIELNSTFGKSSKYYGPNEFSEFWYRWFSKEHTLINDSENLVKEIAGITEIFQKHLVLKNVVNSMRINQLNNLFKNPIFILLKRDYLDNAQSILNARKSLYNDKNYPWSVITPTMKQNPGLPYYIQIVKQIHDIHSIINSSIVAIGDDKLISVDYKDLCCDTPEVLNSILLQLRLKNFRITKTSDFPDKLDYSTGQKVSNSDYSRLKKEIEKIEK